MTAGHNNLNRRRFVQLLGGTVVAIAAPLPQIAEALPRLVGDGIHNDAPALNALLRGLPIEVGPLVNTAGSGWDGDTLKLPKGTFLLDEPVFMGADCAGKHVNFQNSGLVMNKAECCIRVDCGGTVSLENVDMSFGPNHGGPLYHFGQPTPTTGDSDD